MSGDDADSDVRLPRETSVLFGHAEAERALLEAYKSGRIPHAWLIGGPPGIGKATLAYRLARFVLAHPDPRRRRCRRRHRSPSMPTHPVARRIAAQAQGDLLVLERVINEQTGKLYTVIRVDDVRRSVPFFGSTAGEGGWRIAIVDAVDELQREGANALLKVLEEPPPRALLLLVSHAPGPRAADHPLALPAAAAAAARRGRCGARGCRRDRPRRRRRRRCRRQPPRPKAASRARIGLLDGAALALRQRVLDLFAQLPEPDPRALHALGDALGGSEPQTLAAFMDMVNGWLSARLSGAQAPARTMARIAEIWEKVNRAARDVETYNLERKPLVFAVFA